MEYKVITDEEGFLAEKEQWNRLCKAMKDATPFQTWQWNYYWWKHNEPKESLYIIKAFEGKQVYGYAPIVVKNHVAQFIGGRDMDYGYFIVNSRQNIIIEGFLQVLLQQKYALELQEMPSRGSQLHIVQKVLEDKRRYLVNKTTRSAYVELEQYEGMDAYVRLLSQSMRNKTIKPAMKKGLTIQKEAVTDNLFQEIEEIYVNRQDVRGGAPDITWSFPVIRDLNREGLADVYMARKDSTAVGFLVAMRYDNNQYIWLVAFKMEYRDCFPGQLLFYSVLRNGFENGSRIVDFMRGDYDFKMRWECKLDTNYTVHICRNYTSYWKKKLYFAIKPVAKRIIYGNPVLERIYRKHGK